MIFELSNPNRFFTVLFGFQGRGRFIRVKYADPGLRFVLTISNSTSLL